MRLCLAGRAVELRPDRPLVMGVLNATPDSFSDGGRHGTTRERIDAGRRLLADGADIVDVGGESLVTRRPAVSPEEEVRRVAPVVEALAGEGALVSVDTWKAPVARAALAAGAVMVNDPSGLRDPATADACASVGAALVLTHTRIPPKRKDFPGRTDVTTDILPFLRRRVLAAGERGVGEDQLVLDPGIDLGKTPAESVDVLRRLGELRALGRPLLLAVSRKDFLGAVTGRRPRERVAGTLAAIAEGLDRGAGMLRVHDVAEVRDYLRVRAILRGEEDVPAGLRLRDDLRWQRGAA